MWMCFAGTPSSIALFYAQYTLNPREEYHQPKLRNVVYSCILS